MFFDGISVASNPAFATTSGSYRMYILGRALPATNPSSATAFTARPKRAASFFVRSPFVVFVKSVALLTSVIQKNSSRPGIPGQGSKSSALPAAPVDINPNVMFGNSSPHENRCCKRHHQAARRKESKYGAHLPKDSSSQSLP